MGSLRLLGRRKRAEAQSPDARCKPIGHPRGRLVVRVGVRSWALNIVLGVRYGGMGGKGMTATVESFSGREFRAKEIELIRETVTDCAGLSRMELARTVCELIGWRRPNGSLKARECREYLERLDEHCVLTLPNKRRGRPVGSVTFVPHTTRGEPGSRLGGSVRDIEPITIERVSDSEQRLLFRELVGRHHYLGHKVAFGAHLRYLVYGEGPDGERIILGCLQYSSPAWRMAVRDGWLGWDDATRARNLQHVISNSRFLLLPWLEVKNPASAVLARGLRQVALDWPRRYNVQPWLVETLVDSQRYHGGCYRAANWCLVGETTGRGRMDRHHRREGEAPKSVLVYPLVVGAARRLRQAGAMLAVRVAETALESYAMADDRYQEIKRYLCSLEAHDKDASDVEREIKQRCLKLMRDLLQANLDTRGPGEAVRPVRDADGVEYRERRTHRRKLETVFGTVEVERIGYASEGRDSLHPLDADLKLPRELYSLELRRQVAQQAAKNSFDDTIQSVEESTGAEVPKRQAEELVQRSATDFDAFYEQRQEQAHAVPGKGAVLVLTVDGKGLPMHTRTFARRLARQPKSGVPSSSAASRKARRSTASGWRRSPLCTQSLRTCAPRPSFWTR